MKKQPSALVKARRNARYFLENLALRSIFALLFALPYPRRVALMGWLAAQVIAPVAGWRARAGQSGACVPRAAQDPG